MKPIKVYLTDGEIALIDAWRGNASRSFYVATAALDRAATAAVEQAAKDAARKEAAEKAAKEQG